MPTQPWLSGQAGPEILVKVLGLGGAGVNIASYIHERLEPDMEPSRRWPEPFVGIETVACDTDAGSIGCANVSKRLLVGGAVTRGRGCGGNQRVGREAVESGCREILEACDDADIVFVVAGLGGGTGGGGIAVVANAICATGIPVAVLAITPLAAQRDYSRSITAEALDNLRRMSITTILFPMERLVAVAKHGPRSPIRQLIKVADRQVASPVMALAALDRSARDPSGEFSFADVARFFKHLEGMLNHHAFGVAAESKPTKTPEEALDLAMSCPSVKEFMEQSDALVGVVQLPTDHDWCNHDPEEFLALWRLITFPSDRSPNRMIRIGKGDHTEGFIAFAMAFKNNWEPTPQWLYPDDR